MEFYSSDREVIELLFSTDEWLDLYELHTRFSLSPAQILDILDRLVRADFAEVDGAKARLNEQGRAWVIKGRVSIFLRDRLQSWRPDAGALLGDSIGISEPYLPDTQLIDRGFFTMLGLAKARETAK